MQVGLSNSPLKVRIKEISASQAKLVEGGTKLVACIKSKYMLGTVNGDFRKRLVIPNNDLHIEILLDGIPEADTRLFKIMSVK